jgi:two-component system, OmpR family, phosphate regulon sensor histidine kinase PhoR
MSGSTPKRVALQIALAATFIFIISIIIVHFNNSLLWILLSGVAVLIAVFLVSLSLLNGFIITKINPLYKTIYNASLQRQKLGKDIHIDLLAEAKENVENWTNDKTKEIVQLKQLEKYRREFLGNVSHELKTPIFNIQGYVLTLLDGGLEDPSINKAYLERTEKSINRMINIVEDLESISRLESGELKLEFEDFDIISLIEDIFEMQEMLANKCDINLEVAANSPRSIKVNADKKRITEVLNNLIVNSIKYGRSGGKTTISFYDIGDQIMIEVADTGIGISEKDISRIFERFYRTDKSRSRDQGGTGLGLSIVKHIIEAHEQTINVRSQPGEGSSFTFTLNKTKK